MDLCCQSNVSAFQGSQETPGVTGKFGLGIQNEVGQRLIEFCQENARVIANTLFRQHRRRLLTWTSTDGQYWNQTDYTLCSQRWRSSIISKNKIWSWLWLKSWTPYCQIQTKIVKATVFPVVMHGYESWTAKKGEHQKIDAFELWCWRRLLRVPWTARKSNQSILKEISPEYSLEGLMLKVKLQYFGHLMWRTDSFERPWCWERLKAGGEGDDRGWDVWMASPTQWTWVWVNSRSG